MMGSTSSLISGLGRFRYSQNVVDDVAQGTGAGDQKALLAMAATFDDGNRYLNREELGRAARALQTGLPRGYRFSSNIVSEVMKAYALTDTVQLMRAAIARNEGGRYLNREELVSAAQALVENRTASAARGLRYSPSVLAQVMTQTGVADEKALLATARRVDDGNRYLNRAELEAAAKILAGDRAAVGIISDLDKTIIPPIDTTFPEKPYPGVTTLFREINRAQGARENRAHYVTARTADWLYGVGEWLAQHDLPKGGIDGGVGPNPWAAQAEKVADIEKLLEQNPGKKFILFGDTNHRDPDAYREVMAKHPDRFIGAFIHRTKNIDPARLQGVHLFEDYDTVAAKLYQKGILDREGAKRVMVATQLEGVSISDAQIESLLNSHRP